MEKQTSIKLHLGCGKRYLPGYTHIDLSDYPHIDHRCSVDQLPMFEDESVDLIYASHVLEYFSDQESVVVLQEWRKKLKTGGILRLAVPNFEALCHKYFWGCDIKYISGPILGIWEVSPGKTIQHKCLYDYEKLKCRLKDCGFPSVYFWDWKQVFVGALANFDDYSQAYLPHMHKEDGVLISLNVEAVK